MGAWRALGRLIVDDTAKALRGWADRLDRDSPARRRRGAWESRPCIHCGKPMNNGEPHHWCYVHSTLRDAQEHARRNPWARNATFDLPENQDR